MDTTISMGISIVLLLLNHLFTTTICAENITYDVALLTARIDDELCGVTRLGGDKCGRSWGVQTFIESLSDGHFANGTMNASIDAQLMFDWLSSSMHNKIAMCNNISDALIRACDENFDDLDIPTFNDLYYAGGWKNASLAADTAYNSVYRNYVSMNYSVYRIPPNSEYTDSTIQYDARLGYILDKWHIFQDNAEQLSDTDTYNTQYFGSASGVFRIWPGKATGKSNGVYKSYDPRSRPWFTKSTSGSSNVVILMDVSDSMTDYGRFAIEKDFISAIVETVGQNTKVSVIAFGTNVNYSCFADDLISMTGDNSDEISAWVANQSVAGWTNFEKAFNAAYDIFDEYIANDGGGCENGIIFFTDGFKNEGSDPANVIRSRNTDVDAVVHSITIGDNADKKMASKLASMTGGIHLHFGSDFDRNVMTALLPLYLYYNYGREGDSVVISDPYFSFSTGGLMVTITKTVYHGSKFVGTIGIDAIMRDFSNALGDLTVGYNSYWFIFDRDSGNAIVHPSLEDDSSATTDINNLEPPQFTDAGIKDELVAGTTGYRRINATIATSFGSLGGYVQSEGQLLYMWQPIADTALAMCVVAHTDEHIEPPFVPDFGFESIPEDTCDTDYTDIANLSHCVYPFNMPCRLDLAQSCNLSYLAESGIHNNSDSRFYQDMLVSTNYSCWHVPPGLWMDTSDVTDIDATCDQMEALFQYTTDKSDVSLSELPWGGFRMNITLRNVQIFGLLQEMWQSLYAADSDNIGAIWLAMFDGVYYLYPAQTISSDFDPQQESWYKTSIAYPEYFVFSAPYIEAASSTLVVDASTVVYGPSASYPFGVIGFAISYAEFLDWIGDSLSVCDSPTEVCYLIDFSAGVVYYEGVFWVEKEEVSSLFFGDLEPTIMQDFLEKGFYQNITYDDYEDDTTTQAYIHDYDVYISANLSTDAHSFERNSGEYSVHWLEDNNLYLVYIQSYEVTLTYPDDCPDNDDCSDVITPGCVTDSDGSCVSAYVAVCDEPDELTDYAGTYCSNDPITDSGAYLSNLKDGRYTDMCTEFSMGSRLHHTCLIVNTCLIIVVWMLSSH